MAKLNMFLIIGYQSSFVMKVAIILSIIVCAIYECKNNIKNFIIITISLMYQFIVCVYILGGISSQKANIIVIIIFFFIWIQNVNKEKKEESKIVAGIIIFLLILNIIYGAQKIGTEIKQNYSSAKKASIYINENIEEGSVIITNNLPYCSAIIPYTNKVKFWDLLKEDYFSFVNWDGNTTIKIENIENIKETLDRNFDKNQKIYLVYTEFNEEETKILDQNSDLTKIFESDEAMEIAEFYNIYEINR